MASNVVLSIVPADPAPLAHFFNARSDLHFNIYGNINYDRTQLKNIQILTLQPRKEG